MGCIYLSSARTDGENKSSRYLLQSYYITSTINAQLVEKTALLLHISSLDFIISVENRAKTQ